MAEKSMADASDNEDTRTFPEGLPLLDAKSSGPAAKTNEILLITGRSGAGRTEAGRALEDLDWYVVDNLPPSMLPALADMMAAGDGIHRLAAVVDVRSHRFFADFNAILDRLSARGIIYRLVFLEASDSALVKRYESNRRPHPLQGQGTVMDGIYAENKLLAPLRNRADVLIDTTNMSIHDLHRHVREAIAEEGDRPLQLTLESFGFKYGIPLDADDVLDVRFLKNPYWVDELRHLTGRDQPVADYVFDQPGAKEFAEGYVNLMAPVLKGYLAELKPYVTIGIGCTGGRHRSVAMTEFIGERLRERGFSVRIRHRDLGRQ